mgnify:CR=1 FL=1
MLAVIGAYAGQEVTGDGNIASGQNAGLPPELRDAARRLLGSESFARRLDDVAYEAGGIFDGQRTFSDDDLAGFR